ncbi:MAG: DUF1127 domain-containing protein [Acidiferrobacterales bacterium]
MQNVMSNHHQKVLATLYRLDPVHVALTERSRMLRTHTGAAIAHRLVEPLRRWYRSHVTVRQLEGLSDWQLKDIGVVRGEIPAFVDALLAKETPPKLAYSEHQLAA